MLTPKLYPLTLFPFSFPSLSSLPSLPSMTCGTRPLSSADSFTEAEISSLPLVALTVIQAFEPFIAASKAETEADAAAEAAALLIMTSVPTADNGFEDGNNGDEAESEQGAEQKGEEEEEQARELRHANYLKCGAEPEAERQRSQLQRQQLEAVQITAATIAGAGDFHIHGHCKNAAGRSSISSSSSTLSHLHHPGYKCPQLSSSSSPAPASSTTTAAAGSTTAATAAAARASAGVGSPMEVNGGEDSASDYTPSVASSSHDTDIGYAATGRQRRVTHPLTSTLPYKTSDDDYDAGVASFGTAGKTCLIQGGAGGLGSIAIQYAKWVLQMHVIVTCSKRNNTFCKKLGADVCLDYHEKGFLDTSRFLKCSVDVVFDPYSWIYREKTLNSNLPIMRPGGWYLDIASSPHSRAEAIRRGLCDPLELAVPEASVSYLMARGVDMATVGAKSLFQTMSFNLLRACTTQDDGDGDESKSAIGAGAAYSDSSSKAAPPTHMRTPRGYHYSLTYVKSNAKDLRNIARYCRAGFILPVVGKRNIFPFTTEAVRGAFDKVQTGHCKGKVVIAVSSTASIRGGLLGGHRAMSAVFEQSPVGTRESKSNNHSG